MAKGVRVGMLGLRRGAALARLAQQAGMQVVAVCERDDRRREEAAAVLARPATGTWRRSWPTPWTSSSWSMTSTARPVAIRALEQGLSVLSETAACRTLAEGVALIAAERSSGIYMFAARGRRLVPRSAGPLTENATDGSSLHHGQPSNSRTERNDLLATKLPAPRLSWSHPPAAASAARRRCRPCRPAAGSSRARRAGRSGRALLGQPVGLAVGQVDVDRQRPRSRPGASLPGAGQGLAGDVVQMAG
jgi:hypothetical protein